MDRLRLDEAIVAAGLAPSRSRARDMVLRGAVTVDGERADRPGRRVAPIEQVQVADPAGPYVSRAALKLAAALDHFGFNPAGLIVLDLGTSTGGFTQVLLERGAAQVIAIDVGHDQLDPSLRSDPRVRAIEGLNARDLKSVHLEGRVVEAIVADVSFISLKLALPPALRLAGGGAWGVFLVKPQFEVGRERIGKGGVVRDSTAARAAADDIAVWIAGEGWTTTGLIPSPIAGGDGNTEYLLGGRKP